MFISGKFEESRRNCAGRGVIAGQHKLHDHLFHGQYAQVMLLHLIIKSLSLLRATPVIVENVFLSFVSAESASAQQTNICKVRIKRTVAQSKLKYFGPDAGSWGRRGFVTISNLVFCPCAICSANISYFEFEIFWTNIFSYAVFRNFCLLICFGWTCTPHLALRLNSSNWIIPKASFKTMSSSVELARRWRNSRCFSVACSCNKSNNFALAFNACTSKIVRNQCLTLSQQSPFSELKPAAKRRKTLGNRWRNSANRTKASNTPTFRSGVPNLFWPWTPWAFRQMSMHP